MYARASEESSEVTDEIFEREEGKNVDKVSAMMCNVLNQYCTGAALTKARLVMDGIPGIPGMVEYFPKNIQPKRP